MSPEAQPDGLFGPESMMWRINRERAALLSGPAAAVLQVAHPQVAMGVAAHSGFRSDPTGRLRRTLEAVYAVAFGTHEEVRGVRKGVARAHRRVRGEGYSAFDQGAQLWVLATLVMGSATMYRRFVGKLTVPELDLFLKENARFGEVYGLDPAMVPGSWGAFENYYAEMLAGPLLGSHPLCSEVANAVIKPDAPWFMRALSPVFRALAVERIPAGLRERLRIGQGPVRRALWPALDALLPALLRLCPASARFAPQYLLAEARVRACVSRSATSLGNAP